MKRTLFTIFAGMFVVVITCGDLWAQATAQMGGIVRDQSGAVLPGAEVTATQTDTGITRTVITNETGFYILPSLPLGPYRLEAALPGFRTFVRTGIVLQVGGNPTININLEVGQVTQTVEVQANAALVETRNVSVGQVMETARIVELPLNGRNAQELLLLGGAAVQAGPPGGQSYPNRLLISSVGELGVSMETTLDGIRHVDVDDGYPLVLPFPDALAEFKAEVSGLSAQQAKGSQVSAVTKSGSNDFHATLFEFVRNDLFNARNYFATTNSTLKRNQFGGTIGGPIKKNRLFFMTAYQGTTLRQDPANVRQFVPTAAMLAGDFTAYASAACNARAVTLSAPFVNNRVNPALFSPVALKLSARLPKPNNECGEIVFGGKRPQDESQSVNRIDYQSSDKHSVFARFLFSSIDQPSAYKLRPDNILNTGSNTTAKAYSFTVGSTYLVSARTVNAFRLSFNRIARDGVTDQFFDLEELGSKVYSGDEPKRTSLSVTGGFRLGGTGTNSKTQNYQLSEDVTITRGTHQFGFGGWLAHGRIIYFSTGRDLPQFAFSGSVTGRGLADFLLGKPATLIQGGLSQIFTRANFAALYVQDAWQVTPRLTLNGGLRWSPILPQVDTQRPVPFVINWDVERYKQGLRSTVFVNAPPGFLFAGDAGFKQKWNHNPEKPMGNVWNASWKKFAPRVGLAWDVQGDGRTSLRASYGIHYDDYPMHTRAGTESNMAPYGGLTRIVQPEGGLDDPWRTFPGGDPFPLRRSKDMLFPPLGEYIAENANLTPTYTQTWNLSLQREVVSSTVLSLSYIGTQIIHTQFTTPSNLAIFVPGVGDASGNCFLNGNVTHFKVTPGSVCSSISNTQERRALSFLNPAFQNEIGRIGTRDNGGTQNYHGMLVSATYRTPRGINMNANYTLSHCIGDYLGRSNGSFGTSVDQTLQDPKNRRRDRGNCEMDQRQNLNLTGVAETPRFANRTLRLIGSGWRLSGIYRLNTGGTIFNVNQATGLRTVTLGAAAGSINSSAASVDRCLCDVSGQRPNQVLGNVYLDTSGRPETQWLNPAAFALPTLGTLGNMGRATLRLPKFWQFDLALVRVYHLRETHSLEFRTEAYNVLNSFRPGAITTDLSSSQFGRIRNALDPRILQFALKYLF